MSKYQEIFSKVYVALYKQAAPSRDVAWCRYRMPNGNKCAAGHLIPDNLYNSFFENLGAFHPKLVEDVWNPLGYDYDQIDFIDRMQRIHDTDSGAMSHKDWFEGWKSSMLSLAREFQLNIPDVSEVN